MAFEKGALPAKLYFRIGEVSELVGVEPHVLRYWEREFRSVRPTKSARGQRVYSRRDVETLMNVRELLYSEGFTIAGARKKLLTGKAALDAERAAKVEAAAAAVANTEAAPVATASAASTTSPIAREALLEMKAEIEAFLDELGG
jgi:hypothetical protein